MPAARRQAKPQQQQQRKKQRHLERDLAVGGACSATGLYVSYIAMQKVYQTTQLLVDLVLPPKNTLPEDWIRRSFMIYSKKTGWALLARDEANPGCAMWLTKCGIFYVVAPSFHVLELRNGVPAAAAPQTKGRWNDWRFFSSAPTTTTTPAPPPPAAAVSLSSSSSSSTQTVLAASIARDAEQKVRLPPHAYHLFKSAQTWAPTDAHFLTVLPLLQTRMQEYADECLLQMFFSDLRQRIVLKPQSAITTEIQKAALFLLMRIIDYTKPATLTQSAKRLFHLDSAPSRPTASQLWRDFDASHPKFFSEVWNNAKGLTPAARLKKDPFFQRAAFNVGPKQDSFNTLAVNLQVSTQQLNLQFEVRSSAEPFEPFKTGEAYDIGPAVPVGSLYYTVRSK